MDYKQFINGLYKFVKINLEVNIYVYFSKKFADYIDQYFIGICSAPALVGIDVLVY